MRVIHILATSHFKAPVNLRMNKRKALFAQHALWNLPPEDFSAAIGENGCRKGLDGFIEGRSISGDQLW